MAAINHRRKIPTRIMKKRSSGYSRQSAPNLGMSVVILRGN